MELIKLSHPYNKEEIIQEDIVLALGFFDGVHLGHQKVLEQALEIGRKRHLPVAVMTFNQHPKIIYSNIQATSVQYLSPIERKLELLEDLGLDYTYLIDYSVAFGTQKPKEFVDNYIVGLNAQVVVAGFDYTYGPREEANMQTLPEDAAGRFEVVEVSEYTLQNHKVGSSTIKDLLRQGQLEEANRELGYIYETWGRVIHGEKRGRQIGYPTANVQTYGQQVLPGIGVYVVEFYVQGQWYQGMASIGYNITFAGERDLSCEVYILDFDQIIYDQAVKVRWHKYLRGEIKFDDVQGLIDQLDQDLVDTRAFFAENN
ncbi:riboflavin biosynthesis protein RibF [Hutsoniella sourekii]